MNHPFRRTSLSDKEKETIISMRDTSTYSHIAQSLSIGGVNRSIATIKNFLRRFDATHNTLCINTSDVVASQTEDVDSNMPQSLDLLPTDEVVPPIAQTTNIRDIARRHLTPTVMERLEARANQLHQHLQSIRESQQTLMEFMASSNSSQTDANPEDIRPSVIASQPDEDNFHNITNISQADQGAESTVSRDTDMEQSNSSTYFDQNDLLQETQSLAPSPPPESIQRIIPPRLRGYRIKTFNLFKKFGSLRFFIDKSETLDDLARHMKRSKLYIRRILQNEFQIESFENLKDFMMILPNHNTHSPFYKALKHAEDTNHPLDDQCAEFLLGDVVDPREFPVMQAMSANCSVLKLHNVPIKSFLFEKEFKSGREVCAKKLKSLIPVRSTWEEFVNRIESYYDPVPLNILNLPDEFSAYINNGLAIVYPGGQMGYKFQGISSLSLSGMMYTIIRDVDSAFLSFGQRDTTAQANRANVYVNTMFEYLHTNHPFYEDITSIRNQEDMEEFTFRLQQKAATIDAYVIPRESLHAGNQDIDNETKKILLVYKKNANRETTESEVDTNAVANRDDHNESGNGNSVVQNTYRKLMLPLDQALSVLFPCIFPRGPIGQIPGNSIRDQAKNLLLCHPRLRSGRNQSRMTLYLCDIIIKAENNFHQFLSRSMRILMPQNTFRYSESALSVSRKDPSFNGFWKDRRDEAAMYTEHFGHPDLMVTLTFGNHWEEVIKTEQENAKDLKLTANKLPINQSPVDTMMLWKKRFNSYAKQGFKSMMKKLGFPQVIHYIWRLEFQVRGAPHAHVLLWLKEPLDLSSVQTKMHATIPPDYLPKLKNIVTKEYMHTCKPERCFGGKNSRSCKYGFPKPIINETEYDENGAILYKRSRAETRMVEHSPALALYWGAHAHIHVLRTKEFPDAEERGIAYVVKYNMKGEVNMAIAMMSPDKQWELIFKGRVISAEEAAARIFSMSYVKKDVTIIFIDTVSRDSRRAYFTAEGIQQQMDSVEKYFRRPKSLERMTILDFYSEYDVNAIRLSVDPERSIETVDCQTYFRPPNTLSSLDQLTDLNNDTTNNENESVQQTNGVYGVCVWEQNNLQLRHTNEKLPIARDSRVPTAMNLYCKKRKEPRIVSVRKFNPITQKREWLYHLLLISGCWRSEEEMLAGQTTIEDSVRYHGLGIPETEDRDISVQSYLHYAIGHERYSLDDLSGIAVSIIKQGILPEDVIRFVNNYISQTRHSLVVQNQRKERLLETVHSFIDALDESSKPVQNLYEMDPQVVSKYVVSYLSSDEINQSAADLRDFTQKLNNDQKRVFDRITDRIGTASYYCINGKAGTGKSFVIEALKSYLRANQIPYMVTASTGIAATLVSGRTLHSSFRIYSNGEKHMSSLDIADKQGAAISTTEFLFVDEITMLPGKVFDVVNTKLRALKAQAVNRARADLPFGGVTVILTGDLGQVPSVTRDGSDFGVAEEMFTSMRDFNSFTPFKLRQVMRQDPSEAQFINLLNEVRSCKTGETLSETSVSLLRSRYKRLRNQEELATINKFVSKNDNNGMVIYYTNKGVETYNSKLASIKLNESNPQTASSMAMYLITGKSSYLAQSGTNQNQPDQTTEILSQNTDRREIGLEKRQATEGEKRRYFNQKRNKETSCLVPDKLFLFVGAEVMILKNIDASKNIVNGRRGVITEFTYVDNTNSCSSVTIKLHPLPNKPVEPPYTVIRQKVDTVTFPDGKKISMFQFPIRLAYAVTAHKAQGQTLDRVAVCLDEEAFTHGLFYVALSRVRRMKDLRLFGFSEFKESGPVFHINTLIQEIENRMDENSEYNF